MATPLFKGVDFKPPPTESPPPQAGKSVWVFSCSQSVTTCATAANAQVAAARAMGWDVTLFDTQFSPARIEEGFRQAIAAGVDGILGYGIDCPLAKQGLIEARNAGVEVVGAEEAECNPPLYTDHVQFTVGDTDTYLRSVGAAQADLAIAHAGSDTNVLYLFETDAPVLIPLAEGFKERFASACEGCNLYQVDFVIGDVTPAVMGQKVQQALVQHPDVNVVSHPFTGILSSGVSAAVRGSGRASDIYIVAGESEVDFNQQFLSGEITGAGVGSIPAWEGWASVDAMNRIFAGQKPVSSGIGLLAYDKDHNLDSAGNLILPYDYVAEYKRAWGVK